MIDRERLEQLEHAAADMCGTPVGPDGAAIAGDTPAQRLESLLELTGSPYALRVGDVPVRLSFRADGEALEEALFSHFLTLWQKHPPEHCGDGGSVL